MPPWESCCPWVFCDQPCALLDYFSVSYFHGKPTPTSAFQLGEESDPMRWVVLVVTARSSQQLLSLKHPHSEGLSRTSRTTLCGRRLHRDSLLGWIICNLDFWVCCSLVRVCRNYINQSRALPFPFPARISRSHCAASCAVWMWRCALDRWSSRGNLLVCDWGCWW